MSDWFAKLEIARKGSMEGVRNASAKPEIGSVVLMVGVCVADCAASFEDRRCNEENAWVEI